MHKFESLSRNSPAPHRRRVVEVTVVEDTVVAVMLVADTEVDVSVPVVEVAVTDVIVVAVIVVVVPVAVVEVAVVVVIVVVVQRPPSNDASLPSHSKHTRSDVAVASSATYSPATHSVVGEHSRSCSPGTGPATSYSPSAHESLMVPQT